MDQCDIFGQSFELCEAMKSKYAEIAMQEEYDLLMVNRTWKLTIIPRIAKVYGTNGYYAPKGMSQVKSLGIKQG